MIPYWGCSQHRPSRKQILGKVSWQVVASSVVEQKPPRFLQSQNFSRGSSLGREQDPAPLSTHTATVSSIHSSGADLLRGGADGSQICSLTQPRRNVVTWDMLTSSTDGSSHISSAFLHSSSHRNGVLRGCMLFVVEGLLREGQLLLWGVIREHRAGLQQRRVETRSVKASRVLPFPRGFVCQAGGDSRNTVNWFSERCSVPRLPRPYFLFSLIPRIPTSLFIITEPRLVGAG